MATSSERSSFSGVTSSKWRAMILRFLRQLLALGDRFLDAADHVEGALRKMVVLAVDDRLERADRILDLHELAGDAGEDLGDVEGLREEALQLAGPVHGELILF